MWHDFLPYPPHHIALVDDGVCGSSDSEPVVIPVRDFYLTDPISRASATMRLCSDMKLEGDGSLSVTGTHG